MGRIRLASPRAYIRASGRLYRQVWSGFSREGPRSPDPHLEGRTAGGDLSPPHVVDDAALHGHAGAGLPEGEVVASGRARAVRVSRRADVVSADLVVAETEHDCGEDRQGESLHPGSPSQL